MVGCCSIDDYFEDNIKKHELTKPDIEKDRKTHILTSQKQYEAVFLIYPEVEEIDALIINEKSKPCIYNFATNGVTHRLWVVNAPAMTHQISKLFEDKVPVLYIADGHHRTAAGALSGRELRKEVAEIVKIRRDTIMYFLLYFRPTKFKYCHTTVW